MQVPHERGRETALLSGGNRMPVSPRRQSHQLPPPSRITYSQPFPPPSYLRHASLYADRFYTTPDESSVLGGSVVLDAKSPASILKKKPGISDALSLGTELAGGKGSPLLLPTVWDEDDRCALLELSSDGMGVSFAGSAKNGDRDAAAIRANRPVPTQAAIYFFEVTVVDKGVSGYIGIGLSHRTVSLSRLPGWEENSFGYHADDGHAFCSQGTGEPFGPTFTTGDVIGCGVDWTNAGPPRGPRERSGPRSGARSESQKQVASGGRVFFTKNGEFLGYAACGLQGKLYPTVGLRTPNESVRVNFGAQPFRFDIEALVLERKRTILTRIASTSASPASLLVVSPSPPIPALLPPSSAERLHETLQTLIGSYLAHHGYAATANAFSKQVVAEREERANGLIGSDSTSASNSTAAPVVQPDLVASITASSATRSQIRSAAASGHAHLALQLLQQHYPSVLEEPDRTSENGGVLFRLRCRAFVEATLALGRANDDPAATYLEPDAVMSGDGGGGGAVEPGSGGGGTDGEDAFSTPLSSPSISSATPATLDTLLTLGRSLTEDYSTDPRPAVREELKSVLGLLAYSDPQKEASGRTRALLSVMEREMVAEEVNRAVLLVSSLPPIPALEQLYRHTAASIQLAGDLGSGSAAMVDIRKEVLEGL